MQATEDGLYAAMRTHGISRRTLLKFSAAMAATLALPAAYATRIAAAVETAPKLPVVWMRGQDCGGNTQAFLRASSPTVPELVLDLLSVEYHDTLMAAAGGEATQARLDVMERFPGGYLAVVEGAIPRGESGAYCTLGGRPFTDVVREVCDGAAATIAVGSCAFDGGAPAAHGGRTDATGVASIVGSDRLASLPGCPLNVENLTATIVHFLTFGELPPRDGKQRPLFAYGSLIHNECERRAHYEYGEFALAWGDEGAQKGWCLYKLGCKGPEAFANCGTVRFGEGTSWTIKAGHGCIGCTMPGFWDGMGPAYERLPPVSPLTPGLTADTVGVALVGGVAAVTVVHGSASFVRSKVTARSERRAAEAAALAAANPMVETPGADAGDAQAGDRGSAPAPATMPETPDEGRLP
jgi:hydrogenase small subunit